MILEMKQIDTGMYDYQLMLCITWLHQ